MGFTISVLACADAHKDAFLAVSGLRETDEADPQNEAHLSGASDGQHFFVWQNLHQAKMFGKPDYKAMSQSAPFYRMEIVESVNGASVQRFEGGDRVWWIEGGMTGFAVIGTPPITKDDLVARLEATRKANPQPDDDEYNPEKDAFGLATEAFAALTGFRYDEQTKLPFTVLEGQFPQKKAWWRFW